MHIDEGKIISLIKSYTAKIKLLVSTFARNSGNCGCVGCYYNPIIVISIILIMSIRYTKKQNNI